MTDKKKPEAYIFGDRPNTISAPVEFESVTGTQVSILCDFQYRDRVEFAAFWDEISDAKAPDLPEGEQFSFALLASHGLAVNADRTLQYLASWPLDLELDKENLMRMFREEPAAPAAFWSAYRTACTEGRTGNSKPQ